MPSFLEKFNSKLPNRQMQQVLKLLNKKKEVGNLQNFNEFQQEFQKLMEDLSSNDNYIPSLIFYPATPLEEISVEAHNEMLDLTLNDLTTSFEQINQVGEVQAGHNRVIKETVLQNLRSAMNELKTKINIYRFINRNRHGFEGALYSTFNETKGERTNRALNVPNKLFMDPRTNKFMDSNYDASVDSIAEALTLPAARHKEAILASIEQIVGGEYKSSVYELQNEPFSDINKTIDSLNGTYWLHKIRRKSPDETVKVKLRLKLAGTNEINYLELEPFGPSYIFEQLQYIKQDGSYGTIQVGQLADKKIKVNFSKIATDTLYLVFNIPNNQFVSYENEVLKDFNPLQDFVFPSVADEILQVNPEDPLSFSCYEYSIGIDNIRVGISEFINKGIYVSRPYFMKEEAGILGLTVKEKRPHLQGNEVVFSETPEASHRYLGSFDYWIIRESLNSDDSETADVLKTEVFPICPMNLEQVLHERIVLTKNSEDLLLGVKDIGYLTHFPDMSKDVNVYRNGTLIESGYTLDTTALPSGGSRMEAEIQINNVGAGDIFTVSYTPLKGNSYSSSWSAEGVLDQVDLIGDLTARIGPEKLVLLEENNDERVESYRVYLVIISRQNDAREEITPMLEEYTLAVGKRNLEKFEATL